MGIIGKIFRGTAKNYPPPKKKLVGSFRAVKDVWLGGIEY